MSPVSKAWARTGSRANSSAMAYFIAGSRVLGRGSIKHKMDIGSAGLFAGKPAPTGIALLLRLRGFTR
ncbi:hypothetical protein D3C80_1979360 [compost metagenome]